MKKVVTQLQLNNDTMMTTIDQRFSSFQSEILQTMKELVINMVPQLSIQQRSHLLSPPPNDILHTQPPIYPYHGVVLQHPYPLHTTPRSPLTNMSPPSSYPHTNPYTHTITALSRNHITIKLNITTTTSTLSAFYKLHYLTIPNSLRTCNDFNYKTPCSYKTLAKPREPRSLLLHHPIQLLQKKLNYNQ